MQREHPLGWGKLAAIVGASCATYAALYALLHWGVIPDTALLGTGIQPRVAASFVSFLALPAVLMWASGNRDLLEHDRGWLWPMAFYAAVTALALAFFPSNRAFFAGFDRASFTADFAIWSSIMAMQVIPVDFFTKRVVQRELETLAGPIAGQTGQFAAWMVAHVFELFWLIPLWGVWGSLAFIAATGLLSGFVYARGGSVAAFMLGHWICNIVIALVVST